MYHLVSCERLPCAMAAAGWHYLVSIMNVHLPCAMAATGWHYLVSIMNVHLPCAMAATGWHYLVSIMNVRSPCAMAATGWHYLVSIMNVRLPCAMAATGWHCLPSSIFLKFWSFRYHYFYSMVGRLRCTYQSLTWIRSTSLRISGGCDLLNKYVFYWPKQGWVQSRSKFQFNHTIQRTLTSKEWTDHVRCCWNQPRNITSCFSQTGLCKKVWWFIMQIFTVKMPSNITLPWNNDFAYMYTCGYAFSQWQSTLKMPLKIFASEAVYTRNFFFDRLSDSV